MMQGYWGDTLRFILMGLSAGVLVALIVLSFRMRLYKISGLDVNEEVRRMLAGKQASEVYEFYDKYTKNRDITYLIVNHAILNHIPLHLFLGMAHTESEFRPGVIGGPNNDGSYDYSLFQLNSDSYRKYDRTFLTKPENNVRLAADHLRRNYERYQNWPEAVIAYNTGTTTIVKNKGIKYLASVLEFQDRLDRDFKGNF